MITLTIPGHPIPKARMTHKGRFSDRAQTTLQYQEYIAWHAIQQAGRKVLKGNIRGTFRIYVYDYNKRGDLKNYIAGIEDGLQYAGLIPNDKQITEYGAGTGVYPCGMAEERVEIELEEVAK